MNCSRKFTVSVCAASLILGFVFLMAAFSKIEDLLDFQKTLQQISFLHLWIGGAVIFIIPGLELTLGLSLIIFPYFRAASVMSSLVLLIFIGFEIYLNISNHKTGCGCFKIQIPVWLRLSGWSVVVRDILFLLLSLFLVVALGKTNPSKIKMLVNNKGPQTI